MGSSRSRHRRFWAARKSRLIREEALRSPLNTSWAKLQRSQTRITRALFHSKPNSSAAWSNCGIVGASPAGSPRCSATARSASRASLRANARCCSRLAFPSFTPRSPATALKTSNLARSGKARICRITALTSRRLAITRELRRGSRLSTLLMLRRFLRVG